jgi:hypothetical protein
LTKIYLPAATKLLRGKGMTALVTSAAAGVQLSGTAAAA